MIVRNIGQSADQFQYLLPRSPSAISQARIAAMMVETTAPKPIDRLNFDSAELIRLAVTAKQANSGGICLALVIDVAKGLAVKT
jgi:hypothetical protein